ncbi:MAG: hypothetical protein KGH72_03105 [Candidatus Micrarchaeota archaeon]|nr:hypothetical protein [Candidatus Micrarchaeota archaeon]
MEPKTTNHYLIPIAILALASLFVVISVYNSKGVGWDFLDAYLSGQSLLRGDFYYTVTNYGTAANLSLNPSSPFLEMLRNSSLVNYINVSRAYAPEFINLIETKDVYFTSEKYPGPILVMALAYLIFKGMAIDVYLAILVLLVCIGVVYASRRLKIDPIVLASLLLSVYLVKYTMLFNSSESLSIGILLFAIALLVRDSPYFGLVIGLAGIAKYNNFVFIPMILLLSTRVKKAQAALLLAVPIVPWLAYNFLLFQNPLHSLIGNIAETAANNVNLAADSVQSIIGVVPYPYELVEVLAYPLAALIIFAALMASLGKTRTDPARLYKAMAKDRRYLVISVFLVIAVAGFIVTIGHIDGPVRELYAVYLGLSVLLCLVLADNINRLKIPHIMRSAAPRAVPALFFLVSLSTLALYLDYSQANPGWMQYASNDPVFREASAALFAQGLSNCTVVSNAWPYLRNLNVTAYSVQYYDQPLYNLGLNRVAIVVFPNVGVPASFAHLSNISRVYLYGNFTIYVPADHACNLH